MSKKVPGKQQEAGAIAELMRSLGNPARPRILRTETRWVEGRMVPFHYCESYGDAARRYYQEKENSGK